MTAVNSLGVGNQSPVDIQIFHLYPGNTFITQHILTTCYYIITVINIQVKSGGQKQISAFPNKQFPDWWISAEHGSNGLVSVQVEAEAERQDLSSW